MFWRGRPRRSKARRHDQRMGGIKAAGNPEHDLVDGSGAQPCHQAVDLDVEGFVAALVQELRVIGHEWKTEDRSLQRDADIERRLQLK